MVAVNEQKKVHAVNILGNKEHQKSQPKKYFLRC
jgi:hypothetical protein